jgi:hypothetical protein
LAAKADGLLWADRSAEASFSGGTRHDEALSFGRRVFLFPVALSYGVDPAVTIPKFMNFTVEGTDQTHIFRALMGLYLGMVTFCIIAAFTPEWQHVAVIWAVFFAYSLALGRILSLIADGMPSPILLFYLAVELAVGTWGLLVLARERRKGKLIASRTL